MLKQLYLRIIIIFLIYSTFIWKEKLFDNIEIEDGKGQYFKLLSNEFLEGRRGGYP